MIGLKSDNLVLSIDNILLVVGVVFLAQANSLSLLVELSNGVPEFPLGASLLGLVPHQVEVPGRLVDRRNNGGGDLHCLGSALTVTGDLAA